MKSHHSPFFSLKGGKLQLQFVQIVLACVWRALVNLILASYGVAGLVWLCILLPSCEWPKEGSNWGYKNDEQHDDYDDEDDKAADGAHQNHPPLYA